MKPIDQLYFDCYDLLVQLAERHNNKCSNWCEYLNDKPGYICNICNEIIISDLYHNALNFRRVIIDHGIIHLKERNLLALI